MVIPALFCISAAHKAGDTAAPFYRKSRTDNDASASILNATGTNAFFFLEATVNDPSSSAFNETDDLFPSSQLNTVFNLKDKPAAAFLVHKPSDNTSCARNIGIKTAASDIGRLMDKADNDLYQHRYDTSVHAFNKCVD